MVAQQRLLAMLADGEVHSGRDLAAELGVTRSAIWKHIGALEKLGLEVEARAGQGYRLLHAIELLDASIVQAALQPATRALIGGVDLVWSSPSTNSDLMSGQAPEPGKARALLAEYQSAGRGRRGRQWFAPAGSAISLSVAWQFSRSPDNLACLSLAVGVGALRALWRAGIPAAQLKWPNDVLIEGRKLAGILVDVQGEAGGPLHVVVGIGVNLQVSSSMRAAVQAAGGIAPVGMGECAPGAGRNATAAMLIDELCAALEQFGERGFGPFVNDWDAADCLRGRRVLVQVGKQTVSGTATGITPEGHLRVMVAGTEQQFVTGEVSVRPEP